MRRICKKIITTAAAATTLAHTACNETEIITVTTETGGYNVVEYMPAPGQFINDGYTCNTAEEAAAWAQERLDNGYFVSLGTFGGYIILKTATPVKNVNGDDFSISGNSFDGNSEPGVVWVSPDGMTWYRLKGEDSEFPDYSVTYFQTADGAPGDIVWEDNEGNTGKVSYLPQFHDNSYYPQWVGTSEYTLTGTRLENRLRFNEETGRWETGSYAAGYADIVADTDTGHPEISAFDIDDAVDGNGSPASLGSISFIRIQSAVITPESSPVIGEISTEITGLTY